MKKKIAIVGAGYAGLSSANVLANAGHQVYVFEAHDKVGGAAQSWEKPIKKLGLKYVGEAIHVFAHMREGQEQRKMFEELDLEWNNLSDFVEPNVFARGVTNEGCIVMPNSFSEFENLLLREFPDEKRSVKKFFSHMRGIEKERHVDEIGFSKKIRDFVRPISSKSNLVSMIVEAITRPNFSYGYLFTPTWKNVLDKYFKDPKLKAHFHLLGGYIGLGSYETAGNLLKAVHAFYLTSGAQVPRKGSFQQFPEEMASSLKRKGGELYLKSFVNGFIIKNDTVKEIFIKDKCLEIDEVIWTADPMTLIKIANFPDEYAKNLSNLRKSTSIMGMHGIYEGNANELRDLFDCASLVVGNKISDLDNPLGAYYLAMPTLHRKGLITDFNGNIVKDKHILNIYFQNRNPDAWRDLRKVSKGNKGLYFNAKEFWANDVLREIDLILGSDFAKRILHKHVLTPATISRYMYNNNGEIYGGASTPEQFIPHNLKQETPLDNLVLASHYTAGSGGVPVAISEGIKAAKIIIEKN